MAGRLGEIFARPRSRLRLAPRIGIIRTHLAGLARLRRPRWAGPGRKGHGCDECYDDQGIFHGPPLAREAQWLKEQGG
jgi:hypothetical protein